MSRRTIGGGRVLGSGANLLLPATQPPPSSSSPSLRPNLISPTASSISLPSPSPHHSGSGTSTPPTDPSAQDITSRISLDHPHRDTLAPPPGQFPATDRLICPICNDEMVTLLQLNRHLDDVHKEIEEVRQDEAKDWFRQRLDKAKRFQPLAVLNQKLRGLEGMMDDGEGGAAGGRRGSDPGSTREREPAPPAPVADPDELVRKSHWQRRGEACSEPTCGKRLNSINGAVNCRHCGRLFCDEHTLYRMKLSRSAAHDPVRGDWLRVCETCYKSREGYNDRTGFERDHMGEFSKIRRAKLDKTYLETSRLEKRLTRLTQLLTDPPDEVPLIPVAGRRWGSLAAWAGASDPKKALEQSVVPWEDDAAVSRCPYCQQEFSQYTFRRHHCRTCGKVVCSDPQTGCSSVLGLNVATTNTTTEKPEGQIALDVRLCKDCHSTLFARRDFELEIKTESPLVRLYQNLIDFERGIRMLMPRFQKLLAALQDPDRPPTSAQIVDASKTRKRMLDSFTQYDIAARRIRDMPSSSPTQQKLQKAIHQQASQFLHLHMLPLKTLPKILKHATPDGKSGVNGSLVPLANGTGRPAGALASIHYHNRSFDSSSQISSAASSQISAMEAEEKALRERLIVLEEQKFFVSEMVADARKKRRFDEVAALSGNAEDLSREIDAVQNQLAGLDFEGVYNGLGSGVASPGKV